MDTALLERTRGSLGESEPPTPYELIERRLASIELTQSRILRATERRFSCASCIAVSSVFLLAVVNIVTLIATDMIHY